jgi:hypothetical protein
MKSFKTIRVKSKRFCESCGGEMERMSGGTWGCNNPNCLVWSARLDHAGKFVSVKYAVEAISNEPIQVSESKVQAVLP